MGDYADLNAAPDCLIINNAILQVSCGAVKLFFLIHGLGLLFVELEVFIGLTHLVLSGGDVPFGLKFHLSKGRFFVVEKAHFVTGSELEFKK